MIDNKIHYYNLFNEYMKTNIIKKKKNISNKIINIKNEILENDKKLNKYINNYLKFNNPKIIKKNRKIKKLEKNRKLLLNIKNIRRVNEILELLEDFKYIYEYMKLIKIYKKNILCF